MFSPNLSFRGMDRGGLPREELVAGPSSSRQSARPKNLSEAARHSGSAGSVSTKKRKLAQDIAAAGQEQTPYGGVTKITEIGDLRIPFLCPFACLHMLCNKSAAFMEFLHKCMASLHVGRVCLYCDEVLPGNALRPDHSRAYYAFFWTFLDWPDWYRSTQAGWFDLCVVKSSDVTSVPGGASALTAHLLKQFWDPAGWHLERLGVRVAGPRGPWILRAKLSAFMMDERAEKAIASCKGSSGSKPCISCRNCVGRLAPTEVSHGFKHFSDPGLAGFVPNTYEAFCADLDYLRSQDGHADFARMQQALGIAYDLRSLPFSEMRGCARIPETRYCDWMHNLCASGGVVQYHINNFCIALVEAGMSLAHLDEFQQTVQLPKSHTKLSKSFFRDRTSTNPAAHIKAFAGEVLSIMTILQLFVALVLNPIGAIRRHASLVVRGGEVLEILRIGDGAVRHVDRLRDLCLRYHTEFACLMPQCVKPKMHYLHHTVEQLAGHRCNVSCFAPERKHQFNKQHLNFIFRNMEVALMARAADEMLRLAQQAETFWPVHLRGNCRPILVNDRGRQLLCEHFGESALSQGKRSVDMRTRHGGLHRKDLCTWVLGDGQVCLGIAEWFYFVPGFGCFILMSVCDKVGACWQPSHVHKLVEATSVGGAMAYFVHEDGRMTPHWPAVT